MLISVCIPHYNRSRYLLAVLDSIRVQDHPEVEVIISDDCSTDDSAEVIPKYIASIQESTQVRFNYIRQPKNLGYDGNLRAALGAGRGDYLFVLGNDDCFSDGSAISNFVESIQRLGVPDVCFTNFYEHGRPDEVIRRAKITRVLGSGPDVAARVFRSFSFVAGLGFTREAFEAHNTAEYDGSIYFQIYLAARIIAAGGTVAGICLATVAKDFKLEEKRANTYLDILASSNTRVKPQTGGLDQVLRVCCHAILPYAGGKRFRHSILMIGQILLITYPFWLFTYREQGVYRAAINLSLGCFPYYLGRKSPIAGGVKLLALPFYFVITVLGLALPLSFYHSFKFKALELSKALLQPSGARAS